MNCADTATYKINTLRFLQEHYIDTSILDERSLKSYNSGVEKALK